MSRLVDIHNFFENQSENRTHYYIDIDDILSIVIGCYHYQEFDIDRIEITFKHSAEKMELQDSPQARAALGLKN